MSRFHALQPRRPVDVSGASAQALVDVCGLFAGREPPVDVLPAIDRDILRTFLRRHGLTAFVATLPASVRSALPRALIDDVKRLRQMQTMRNLMAMRQVREMAEAFADQRIPLLALKGAVSMSGLYSDLSYRALRDVDVLIPPDAVGRAREVMAGLSYTTIARFTSDEEELLHSASKHLSPFVREGALPVEIHLAVPVGPRGTEVATRDVWREAVTHDDLGRGVRAPSPAHFVLHAVSHYADHQRLNTAPLRWLLEISLAVRRWHDVIDWDVFWATTDRWETRRDAELVLATIGHYWHTPVPGLAAAAASPLAPEALVAFGNISEAPLTRTTLSRRIRMASALPDLPSRARYLFRLLFPAPGYLQYRYGTSPGESVAVSYWRYLARQVQRLRRKVG